jgi:3D (Asp-Asp-Asp) domain-containing protein
MKFLAIVTSAILCCTSLSLAKAQSATAKAEPAIAKAKPVIAKSRHIPIVRTAWTRIALRVTAYVVDARARGCSLNTARTASGAVADQGTVAVDTRVFPFGTRFYVPGDGYGRAADTGGDIRGRHIDLAMRSCSRALAWGSRAVIVSYTRA